MIAPAAAVLGLVIGSFLNVVIHRVPRRRSVVWPASSCPKCGEQISPLDNISLVSYLLLRGRCRKCGTPIPIRYPLIEALTAELYGAAGYKFGVSIQLIPFGVFMAFGGIVSLFESPELFSLYLRLVGV
ncbi:MAG TPA: prepilin peptidase [Rubrobacter sp.]|nr:prepilin peptidase [Rubrobacter sp.]